jgi:lipoate-protein ligase B
LGHLLAIEELGCVPYARALERQREQMEARRRGAVPDTLLLLEHPPVITLGRGAHQEHLLCSRDELGVLGIEVHEVSRGGDVTYHGPGQLVGYPILDLDARGERDVHAYLRGLEAVLCDALERLGVRPRLRAGATGVFVEPARGDPAEPPRKIASIGVGVRRWVTYHGFALNVDIDLAGFSRIVACGLHGVEMTSVRRELGGAAPHDLTARARDAVCSAFLASFG